MRLPCRKPFRAETSSSARRSFLGRYLNQQGFPLNGEFEETSMRSIRGRLGAGVLAALLLGVAACSGGGGGAAPPAPAATGTDPNGVDDGSTLTLWARDSLETQTNLLVDAYNKSHQN